MGKYFTEDQENEFLRIHRERYPDAVERIHFVMRHPFRNHDEATRKIWHELRQTAETIDFYSEYAATRPQMYSPELKRAYNDAWSHLHTDVMHCVAAMLGTYEIEEFDPSNPLHRVE